MLCRDYFVWGTAMIRALKATCLSFVVVAAASFAAPTPSEAVNSKAFLGSWCSATAKLTFTANTMTVTWFSDNKAMTYKITGYTYTPKLVTVHWINQTNKEGRALYGEFSANSRQMYLQQTKTTPHRQYHRC
jgi:hypothetical protein